MPLAKWIVGRLYGSISCPATKDDLLSVAMIGLWKSIQGYDPARGAFTTYATMRIRGYLQDWFRQMDFVPRAARKEMESPPALKNWSNKEWHLHSSLVGQRDPVAPCEIREEVDKLLAGCSDKERLYINERFFEGLEFRQIAKRHGVSHQWVYFVINRALDRLREQYAK